MAARHCNKCGERHAAPTGKKCKRVFSSDDEDSRGSDTTSDIQSTLNAIGTSLQDISTRLVALESRTSIQNVPASPTLAAPDKETTAVHSKGSGVAEAVRRELAQIGFETDDEEDVDQLLHSDSSKSLRRRKSGRARTTKDYVLKEVSWPHFDVYKGNDRTPANYDNLNIQEFVTGYLSQLLASPTPTEDFTVRLHHLRDLTPYGAHSRGPWPLEIEIPCL